MGEDPLEIGPVLTQPGFVLRQEGVARHRPQHQPVLFPEALLELKSAIGFLEAHQVVDPGAGFGAAAEHRRRFQDERAIHNPQAAVARRPDMECRQAVLDVARLVDVPNALVEHFLNAGIGHLNHAVGQTGLLAPVAHRRGAQRVGLLARNGRSRPRPAAIDGEHPGLSLAGGEPQRFEIHFQPVGIDVFNMPDRQAGKTKRMVPGHQQAAFYVGADAVAFDG